MNDARDIAEAVPCRKLVRLRQTGEAFECESGETLLHGMLRLGRRGIPVGCVNGGCGICKVRVLDGECTPAGAISRAHVSTEEERCGVTLACRATPCGDVQLDVIGKMQRGFLNQFGIATKPP